MVFVQASGVISLVNAHYWLKLIKFAENSTSREGCSGSLEGMRRPKDQLRLHIVKQNQENLLPENIPGICSHKDEKIPESLLVLSSTTCMVYFMQEMTAGVC